MLCLRKAIPPVLIGPSQGGSHRKNAGGRPASYLQGTWGTWLLALLVIQPREGRNHVAQGVQSY